MCWLVLKNEGLFNPKKTETVLLFVYRKRTTGVSVKVTTPHTIQAH